MISQLSEAAGTRRLVGMIDINRNRDAVRSAISTLDAAIARLEPYEDRDIDPELWSWIGSPAARRLEQLRELVDPDDDDELQNVALGLHHAATQYLMWGHKCGSPYPGPEWRLSFACACALRRLCIEIGDHWL